MVYRVGATVGQEEIAYWEPKLPLNTWMRIVPGRDGLPPAWNDAQLAYCQRKGALPFLSTVVDGDQAKLATLRQHLINMPSWVTALYITDRPEPESALSPEEYKPNFAAFWDMIQGLPADTRAKIRAGHVLSRQWTEDTAGRSYATYDTGVGDFLGVAMYAKAAGATGTQVATSYPNAVTFLAGVKGYRFTTGDIRPRVIPELGAIGIPADTGGTMRAAWLQALVDELNMWDAGVQGWRFDGFIWWNAEGASGVDLGGVGSRRWYQLDRRHSGSGTATDPYTYVIIPGNPAPPVAKFNSIAQVKYTTAPPPPPGAPPPLAQTPPAPTTPPAGPVTPPPTTLPVSGPAAARLLRADYTILVTDANCEVLGDPLHGWTSLQVTKRWKEPGSGQVVIPAWPYVRDQLAPGCRIVILRRVLGRQHTLISGPMEQKLRERADDGDKGGPGVLTLTFVEDLAWLGARLAYPNPALSPEAQTTDYWVYSGNPEAGMLQLVDTQAGPNALPPRRVPKLIVAPFSGIAGTGTVALGPTSDVAPRERLEKLTDVLRRMATLGNGDGQPADSLGFRTRQVGDSILFEPVRSRDLAGEAHFSFGMGNLKYYSFEENAPKLTHPIVGGQADADAGAARFIRELPTTDPAQLAWGRFEGYIPRPGTDLLEEMQAAALEALAEAGQSGRLAVSAADTVDQRYGIHYDEGDLVSIELDVGEYVTAPVQTVSLQAYPTAGEVVGTTIGDQSARYDSPWIQRMRAMDRRLGELERRALTR